LEKKWLEIGVSTGLVAVMIILMLLMQIAAPEGMARPGFALVFLLFMIAMGIAGIKLLDIPQR
jgi:hypothetical protein